MVKRKLPALDNLILNSAFREPVYHWEYDQQGKHPEQAMGRRAAGYRLARPGASEHDDPGEFHELHLVNDIRRRVKEWRKAGYPGATGVTKRLLPYWCWQSHGAMRGGRRFFFCQLEAIETLVWLVEAPEARRAGIEIPGDGGPFARLCSKMATGTGKTLVMAMLIVWHTLNKSQYPQDKRFSKNFLIIAPNITVRDRLKELNPKNGKGSIYSQGDFSFLPPGEEEKINQARVIIHNWHALLWESEEAIKKKRSVDKRGELSNTAYARKVLGDMAGAKNIIVINDEAHHAWRQAAGKVDVDKEDIKEATVWMQGLDRIHATCSIMHCHDFSATPFIPGGKQAEENLYKWIVSDFGLEDAIESGLVKIPRVVVKDDALADPQTYKSKFFHIYRNEDVTNNLNRKGAKETDSLPDLVRQAYIHLGEDWERARKKWSTEGAKTPPVTISVVNRIETAARIEYQTKKKYIAEGVFSNPEKILRVDSKTLEKEGKAGDELREKLNSVGKEGEKGADIQHVIGVGMLSEGWDTRTVTHIIGLRAFTSQLLCEQVVGRGLRRASYDDFDEGGVEKFRPEYVNVYGIPFSFLKRGKGGNGPPPPTTEIKPVKEKEQFEIKWPNVLRVERQLRLRLKIDWGKIKPLYLDASKTPEIVEMTTIIDGKPNLQGLKEHDLKSLMRKERIKTRTWKAASEITGQMKDGWQGSEHELFKQLTEITRKFISRQDRIIVAPKLYNKDQDKRKLIIALNMTSVVNHIREAVAVDSTYEHMIVCDPNKPVSSTGDMKPWRTSKPTKPGRHCHINYTVCDSTWEEFAIRPLDDREKVSAWVKNDHLNFFIYYIHRGAVGKYIPDLIIRFKSGKHLVLEIKGQKSEEVDAKMNALKEWTQAVSEHGGFGHWDCAMVENPDGIHDILAQYSE